MNALPTAAVRVGPPRRKGAYGPAREGTPAVVGGKGTLQLEQRRGLIRAAPDYWHGGLVAVGGAKRVGKLGLEDYVNGK